MLHLLVWNPLENLMLIAKEWLGTEVQTNVTGSFLDSSLYWVYNLSTWLHISRLVFGLQKKTANSYPTFFMVRSTVLIQFKPKKRRKFKEFWWLYFHHDYQLIFTFLLHSLNCKRIDAVNLTWFLKIVVNYSYTQSWFTHFWPNVRTKAEKVCQTLTNEQTTNNTGSPLKLISSLNFSDCGCKTETKPGYCNPCYSI